MLRVHSALFTSVALGTLFLAACSSDSNSSNFSGSGSDSGAGGSGVGGSGTGGKGGGGSGNGGASTGGKGNGGTGNGGAASGGSGNVDAGSGGDTGDSGSPDSGSGGTENDSGAGGTTGAGGTIGTGGTGTGGAGTGGAGTGGTGAGGTGTGGAGTGGTGTGGAGTGGAGTGGTGTGGAGTGGAGTGGASPVDSGTPHMRVFVTKDTWNGNLKGNAASGLDGADALCNTAATNAGLGGTWVAWLSDSTHDAIDRIDDVGPWYLVTGQKVFDDKQHIVSQGPLVAINVNETGTLTAFLPWTGTKANGHHADDTCNDWTSILATDKGVCGSSSATGGTWTATGPTGLPCSIPYNLYCFEQ